MATYSNPHWLLCHIRNSFISTDDTGMCETVMVSDDLPKHYLKKFQDNGMMRNQQQQHQRRSQGTAQPHQQQMGHHQRNYDPPLQEVDFVCYPGLDMSDDEDVDLTAQSFDIQMYPEVGAHRFRSNTAQKLEKMDIARRKAAKTKCVNYEDEVIPPERSDFFLRKPVVVPKAPAANPNAADGEDASPVPVFKSKLTQQIANSPKQVQNKFQEFAKYDGTSQLGVQTKRINVFLSMLPEKERNYPLKICVLSHAKISDVIGLVCYKASIAFPDLPLKSIRHYGLYMTEDNDDLEDFPPLDNREPCSKFGFSHLTLAERRQLPSNSRIDGNGPNKSMTSEDDKLRIAVAAIHGIGSDGLHSPGDRDDVDGINNMGGGEGRVDDLEERIMSQDDMLEAPVFRTFSLNIIHKKFFRIKVAMGISGERIEFDLNKNSKFWSARRAVTYPIDAVAHCEIIEKRATKAVLRIWLNSASGIFYLYGGDKSSSLSAPTHSPTTAGHYSNYPLSFNYVNSSASGSSAGNTAATQNIRFKHEDFETTLPTAEQIYKKLNCILEMTSSEVRREFLNARQRKLEKLQAKKHLKL